MSTPRKRRADSDEQAAAEVRVNKRTISDVTEALKQFFDEVIKSEPFAENGEGATFKVDSGYAHGELFVHVEVSMRKNLT